MYNKKTLTFTFIIIGGRSYKFLFFLLFYNFQKYMCAKYFKYCIFKANEELTNTVPLNLHFLAVRTFATFNFQIFYSKMRKELH